jgi:hypothetical protein
MYNNSSLQVKRKQVTDAAAAAGSNYFKLWPQGWGHDLSSTTFA